MRSAEFLTCATSARGDLAATTRRRESWPTPNSRYATAADSHVVWIGSSGDQLEHGVTLDRMSANVGAGHGVYDAVCGQSFTPLSMYSGPRPRCTRCTRHLEHRAPMPNQERRQLWRSRLKWRSRA